MSTTAVRLVATAAACAALAVLGTATAGGAQAATHLRHYSGPGAQYACNADKAALGSVPGSVVLCDRLNNGVYRLSVVPHQEIPLHLLLLGVTGSFDGLSS
ncbi:hypothetical protein [Nocardia puris]|uniref:Secreted protein n=1 Tax=Nocardia puris TaxID=208602 RepID=A0A366DT84_9NOCA|nr:hypothetical protein [Nocardia puris]RBO92484.1 hypothetical protein DFR74_103127 [Nocardia puris]